METKTIPTEFENFTPFGGKCFLCDALLIKQHLHKDRALTPIQRDELHLALKTESHTLECTSCAKFCWCPLLSTPPSSGRGLCKKCGGTDNVTKPKSLLQHGKATQITQQYSPCVWSCPEHGTIPYDSRNNH